MKVKIVGYDDIINEFGKDYSVSNNGAGKEYACYLVIDWEDGSEKFVESDAMEPEDAMFYRDLGWIKGLVETAYRKGKESNNDN